MIKYQLVLDVAGVIVTNLSPTYWVEISALAGVEYEFLHNQFKREIADIHLLSNHRREWLDPLLAPIRPYIKSITISSSVGLCKPDPEVYTIVNAKLDPMLQVLYIDDQDKNMKAVKELSWNTLTADREDQWIKSVKQILYSN